MNVRLVGQGLAEGSASHLIPQMEGTGKVQLEESSCEKKKCTWGACGGAVTRWGRRKECIPEKGLEGGHHLSLRLQQA